MAEAVKFKYSRYKKIQVRDISPAGIFVHNSIGQLDGAVGIIINIDISLTYRYKIRAYICRGFAYLANM